MLLAEELLFVVLYLPLHGCEQLDQFSSVLGQAIDYLFGVEDVLIVLMAVVDVVLIVVFLPVRLLFFSEAFARPSVVLIVVVLQVGFLHVVALEDALALLGAQVVGAAFIAAV